MKLLVSTATGGAQVVVLAMDPSCATAQDERGWTPLVSLIVDDYAEELERRMFAPASRVQRNHQR